MKKHIILLLCCVALFLCSCSSDYKVDGYENFNLNHSHYELNLYILPSTDFADTFKYTDIEYHYREEYQSTTHFVERSIVAINYEKEIYQQAKEYCIQNMQLAGSSAIEHNGYTFIENTKLAAGQDRLGKSFPHWYNMFAYNDTSNSLLFIGFYGSDYTSNDAQNIRDNWGLFWEKHFSDIHSMGD